MPGNGLVNGLRQIDGLAYAKAADVVFLGVSPLNFGSTLLAGPFESQCISEGLAAAAASAGVVTKRDVATRCVPDRYFGPARGLEAFASGKEHAVQFKNFLRNMALSSVSPDLQPELYPAVTFANELNRLKMEIAKPSTKPITNSTNGSDAAFKWRERGVIEALQKNAAGYALLRYARDIAKSSGARLVVYETPTPSHKDAPNIFPAGYFEEYQEALKSALSDLEIEYVDTSRLFPWNGTFFTDFVHVYASTSLNYREDLHRVLLAWLLEPELLKASGLLDSTFVGENEVRP